MALSEEEKNEKEILRAAVVKRLISLRKRKFTDKAIDDFSWSFRVFLIKFLNLGYEFTHEELLRETSRVRLNKNLRNRILALSNLLEEIKYGSKDVTKESFEWMVNEAERAINLAITGKEFTEQGEREKTSGKNAKSKKEEPGESAFQKLESRFLRLIGVGSKTVAKKKPTRPETKIKSAEKRRKHKIKRKKIKAKAKKSFEKGIADESLRKKFREWKAKGYDTSMLEEIYSKELAANKRK